MAEVSVNRIAISNELLQPSSFPLAIATSSYVFFLFRIVFGAINAPFFLCLQLFERFFWTIFNYLKIRSCNLYRLYDPYDIYKQYLWSNRLTFGLHCATSKLTKKRHLLIITLYLFV